MKKCTKIEKEPFIHAMFVCLELQFEPFKLWKFYNLSCRGCEVMRGHDQNLEKKRGPSPQFYRPGAGFAELDIKFSLAFVALSFTLERGEIAFSGDMCAPRL